MNDPIRFALGVHLHQPVGNFGEVFDDHLHHVYGPLVEALERQDILPVTLHLSGPLLAWLERYGQGFLDNVGRLVADRRLELLLAGYDEPILASLPPEDRIEQIARMRDAIRHRFGVEPAGLWLTERVWEPDLPHDLARAGISYVLVDDRHFLVAGHDREQLHLPWRTEAGGGRVALFPIDEHLRYLVPFRPPEELAEYLRALRGAGHRLAVLADDGEKFGGWPGTRKWVYEDGWMERFGATIRELIVSNEIRLTTFGDALNALPSGGLTYLPSASYREMEAWSLPVGAGRRLRVLEHELSAERLAGPVGALIRGTHWKSFLVKYPESNRMHKKMLALSALCRARGDEPSIRAAVGRAQCNDAYWHGVFGGLYLPHLREAIWRNLAEAESALRAAEGLAAEWVDLDADGTREIWIHSDRFSAVLSPARGGAIEEYTIFGTGINHADVLMRRPELYHDRPDSEGPPPTEAEGGDGAPSIHELEERMAIEEPLAVDLEPRAMLVERLVGAAATRETFLSATWQAMRSWSSAEMEATMEMDAAGVTIRCIAAGLEKRVGFGSDGTIHVTYRWDVPPSPPEEYWFVSELSLFRPLTIDAPDAERWTYPVETVSKSERGFDRTVQGEATVLRWAAAAGAARLTISPT